jgi:5-methyltetrahydropteroyltriglutamate--homocysteine methyltransferase
VPESRYDQYHCEVVGSLLRPDYLKRAMLADRRGEIAQQELEQVQERAARENIELQERCGVEVLTDGEVRRHFWFDPLTVGLAGYAPKVAAPVQFQGDSDEDAPKLPAVTARLAPGDNVALREYEFMRANTDRPVKVTIPGMTYASVLWVPEHSEGAYPDRVEYMNDALRLAKQMLGEIVAAGADYVQLDSPRYTHLVSEEGLATLGRLGLDTETWLAEMIASDNELISGFDDVTFAVHLCRGNHRSMWSVAGGYDAIAERLFNDLACDRIFAEYDSPRSGSFEPLRFLPADKSVVLGLITTKEPALESREDLMRRIEEAAQYVPIERLALSPQCGFASSLPGNLIGFDDQRAKLELLGEVAREVWG